MFISTVLNYFAPFFWVDFKFILGFQPVTDGCVDKDGTYETVQIGSVIFVSAALFSLSFLPTSFFPPPCLAFLLFPFVYLNRRVLEKRTLDFVGHSSG